jgi:hypothetical protein
MKARARSGTRSHLRGSGPGFVPPRGGSNGIRPHARFGLGSLQGAPCPRMPRREQSRGERRAERRSRGSCVGVGGASP